MACHTFGGAAASASIHVEGHGREGRRRGTMTPKQERALEALLAAKSVVHAAELANVSARTLFRWLTEDEFKARYQAASRTRLDTAVGKLRALATEAVETLRAGMVAEAEPVRVRAAVAVLDFAIKVDLDELSARVEALEAAEPHRDRR